jgi:hypothetical protein
MFRTVTRAYNASKAASATSHHGLAECTKERLQMTCVRREDFLTWYKSNATCLQAEMWKHAKWTLLEVKTWLRSRLQIFEMFHVELVPWDFVCSPKLNEWRLEVMFPVLRKCPLKQPEGNSLMYRLILMKREAAHTKAKGDERDWTPRMHIYGRSPKHFTENFKCNTFDPREHKNNRTWT